MSNRKLALIFAAAAVVAALVFAPLRLALAGAGAAGLSAGGVEGTIWNGVLKDASFAGAPLGTLKVGLDPIGLLTANLRLRFSADGPVSGRGSAGVGGAGIRLKDADITAPLAFVFPDLPFRGRLQLKDATIRFQNGTCLAADGALAIDRIGLGVRGPEMPGLTIAGALACRDGALAFPVSGEGQGVGLKGTIRIDGSGRYRIDSRLRATDPTVAAALGLSGFGRTLDGFARMDEGQLGVSVAR